MCMFLGSLKYFPRNSVLNNAFVYESPNAKHILGTITNLNVSLNHRGRINTGNCHSHGVIVGVKADRKCS